jgi:hypothetical protein
MTRIVRTAYRYKRPPRKRKPVALEVPAVVQAAEPAKSHQRASEAAILTIRRQSARTPADALGQPFRAFPSWFLRIERERCGKATMLNEAHTG